MAVDQKENNQKAFPEYLIAKREIYGSYFDCILNFKEVQRHYFLTNTIHPKKLNLLQANMSGFYVLIREKMKKRNMKKACDLLDRLTYTGAKLEWPEIRYCLRQISAWMVAAGYMDIEREVVPPGRAVTEID